MKKLRLREARKMLGLTGVQVAEKLGITPTHYYDLEKGKKRLSNDLLDKLCDILNVPADYLLGRNEGGYIIVTPPELSTLLKDLDEVVLKIREVVEKHHGKKNQQNTGD